MNDIPKRRMSVGKLELAEALPVDKWFDGSHVSLEITNVSLRNRLKEWPYIQMKMPHSQKRLFKISSADHAELLKWAGKGRQLKRSESSQKIKPRKLSLHDICHNLATGMQITSKQMSEVMP